MGLSTSRRHVVEIDPVPSEEPGHLWFGPDDVAAADDVELIDRPTPTNAADSYHAAFDEAPPNRPQPPHVRGVLSGGTAPVPGWGLGTDGWPRRNSRVIRLFRAGTADLPSAVAGRRWGGLVLADRIEHRDDTDGTDVIHGRLWMPYLAPPVTVELRLRPFTARYVQAELVIVSRLRFPRRFFERASLALSRMRVCEGVVSTA